MPPLKPKIRLIKDFLLPNLNKQTFGAHLQWLDKQRKIFKITRIRQTKTRKTEQHNLIHTTWSKLKNLWDSDDPQKLVKAKHRLRCAMKRHSSLDLIASGQNFYIYRVIELVPKPRRHARKSSKKRTKRRRRNVKLATDESSKYKIKVETHPEDDIEQESHVPNEISAVPTDSEEESHASNEISAVLTDYEEESHASNEISAVLTDYELESLAPNVISPVCELMWNCPTSLLLSDDELLEESRSLFSGYPLFIP